MGVGGRSTGPFGLIMHVTFRNRLARVKQAIFLAPFGELSDPRILAELAAAAQERGWDGFFLWDHVNYHAPVRAVADPWVALAAVACATTRLRLGPMVTPLSRRRVQKVARETATLDLLSSGRLTFGVGLGSPRNNELEPFGEVMIGLLHQHQPHGRHRARVERVDAQMLISPSSRLRLCRASARFAFERSSTR